MFNLKNNKPTSSTEMEVVESKPQAESQPNPTMKVCVMKKNEE